MTAPRTPHIRNTRLESRYFSMGTAFNECIYICSTHLIWIICLCGKNRSSNVTSRDCPKNIHKEVRKWLCFFPSNDIIIYSLHDLRVHVLLISRKFAVSRDLCLAFLVIFVSYYWFVLIFSPLRRFLIFILVLCCRKYNFTKETCCWPYNRHEGYKMGNTY